MGNVWKKLLIYDIMKVKKTKINQDWEWKKWIWGMILLITRTDTEKSKASVSGVGKKNMKNSYNDWI